MSVEECPNCGKFSFCIDSKRQLGFCKNCGYEEKVDKIVWNLKYDSGYKELRAVLKYSGLRREHIIKYFELDNPNSPYARFLLTGDVIEVLEEESPETYDRLVRKSVIKCVP
jgi:DNA-directed RNA polymerase subunit M/transcription elongation factor TFIIS